MSDQMNGHAEAEAKIPTLSIKDTVAHGADPQGGEAAILIGSITGQQVRLHFGSLEALADFARGVEAVLNQANQNARANGNEVTIADPVKTFRVGHAMGTPGTLLVVNPDTPYEKTFVFENQQAVDAGKMLVVEGGKRLRIDDAIRGGQKLTTPPKPRIIRPGEN